MHTHAHQKLLELTEYIVDNRKIFSTSVENSYSKPYTTGVAHACKQNQTLRHTHTHLLFTSRKCTLSISTGRYRLIFIEDFVFCPTKKPNSKQPHHYQPAEQQKKH